MSDAPRTKPRFRAGRDEREGARLVVLGLGSNVDGPEQIDRAIDRLSYEYDLLVRSTRYVGPPEVPPDVEPDASAPPYSNAAILIRTADDFDTLREDLRRIEAELGRDRSKRGEVAIDLDILLIQGEVVRKDDAVVVPHPDLTAKRHAAIPSAEVAPFLVHTTTEERLSEIAARLA
ncbi:MAG: 2-amino-4-hydroxy-6-hydroxymethyldihydropteridine diphosphokinase [Planctomycetota bacterium]